MKENEKGAVLLVEAAIVFPIVFLVVFFIISLGNTYYIMAYMDSVANENAVLAANYASNETLIEIYKSGYNLTDHDIDPYKYTVSDTVTNYINSKISSEVNNESNTILSSMAPFSIKGAEGSNKYLDYEWGLFSSTFKVEITYKVSMIPLLKSFGITTAEYKSVATANINDNVEFIRNLDLLRDIFTDFTQTEQGSRLVNKAAGKVKEIISKLGDMLNFLRGN